MGKKEKNTKKKKEKVVYYDDGSAISDMSGVKPSKIAKVVKTKSSSTMKEKWRTYWSAVRMMILPMCAVLGILLVLYLLILLMTGGGY